MAKIYLKKIIGFMIHSTSFSSGKKRIELWTEVHDILQEAVIKTSPKTKKCRKAKCLSEEALQIMERREAKGKGEMERYSKLSSKE